MSETKCPSCGSTLVVTLANAKHCNACGKDFKVERNPLSAAAADRRATGVQGNWTRKG